MRCNSSYNEIFGGKLISMLLTSPEVINEYHNRYKNQPSIIASSMRVKLLRNQNYMHRTQDLQVVISIQE